MPLSSLVDPHGKRLVYTADLADEISATASIAGRPPFSGHLAFGMDPFQLGGIIRAADAGTTLSWMTLAEEIEELYPHYGAVLSKRKRQVCQLPITVHPFDDSADSIKHGDLVTDWLNSGVLQRALFGICDGMGKGYSAHEIIWDSAPGRVVPAKLLYRSQRFFEFNWEDGDTLWLRTAGGFADLAPHKFLVHRHPSKSGLTIRSGLTRQIAFIWMYATFTMRDWALFCQAYGMPIRVGRYGPEASEGDKRVLWRAASSIAGDVSAIIPKSMELEFIKDTERTAGSTLYEKRLDWLDRTVSKVVLGGTAGTDAINGGHAVGREHRAAEQDVERFDAELLSNSINDQIIQPMIAFTFGPQLQYPTLLIGRPDEVPLNDVLSGVANLAGLGLKVKSSEVRDRLGLTKPEGEDETIGGVPDTPPKPIAIPKPEQTSQAQRPFLGELLTLQAEAPPELVELMTQRLAEDAAGAMAGMTDAIRAQFDQAHDLHDLAHRLAGLKLPQAEFVEAMTRGAALATLVGQASLVAEMRRR